MNRMGKVTGTRQGGRTGDATARGATGASQRPESAQFCPPKIEAVSSPSRWRHPPQIASCGHGGGYRRCSSLPEVPACGGQKYQNSAHFKLVGAGTHNLGLKCQERRMPGCYGAILVSTVSTRIRRPLAGSYPRGKLLTLALARPAQSRIAMKVSNHSRRATHLPSTRALTARRSEHAPY
jgi:hypothetical protein